MRSLTQEQEEQLFELIDKAGTCPGMFFGDSIQLYGDSEPWGRVAR